MGIVKENNFTRGISGKVSHDMVFRSQRGNTVLYVNPKRRAGFTLKQQEAQVRFKEATLYGKRILKDIVLRAEYQELGNRQGSNNAYQAAVGDYLSKPVVSYIDAVGYSGKVGDAITVRAVDDFEVMSVRVSIFNADGTLLETGLALPEENGIEWVFLATVANTNVVGSKLEVTATDRPGNKTTREQELA